MAARTAAVLGSPIEHSKSPLLHRAAYRELGLDWDYQKFDVKAAELEPFLDRLDTSWVGLSLTMPLKEEALRLATTASEAAFQTGGANTLVLIDGQRIAHNTDVAGVTYAIERGRDSLRVKPDQPIESATVLGTGATARSVIAALAALGPNMRLQVAGRTPANVERVVAWVRGNFGLDVTGHSLQNPDRAILDAHVVVSTIPGNAVSALTDFVPTHPAVLVDVVYDPPSNPLAEAWVERGGVRMGGLTMLVAQAAEQVRLMTDYDGPLEPIRQAMVAALADSGVVLHDTC